MKLRLILATALTVMSGLWAMADGPFRLHRYDALKSTPINSENIVFVGNSITNMHEWWEAFGSDHRIINRGTSGGFSYEILENLESFIDGKPEKLFLMIGTNDISTGIAPATVVSNIRTIITRIQQESPRTKIHIQSILPRVHEPQNTNNKAANEMLKALCAELDVTYLDLWDALLGVRNYGEWSADGLHLYAAGYRIWCKQIAPYVDENAECVYQDSYSNINSGMNNSNGMRSSYFGMLPLTTDDVIIVGDEMINGGEWHELLRSPRIKSRGTGWGYGGLSLDQHKTQLTAILTGNGNKQNPAKIFFYCGTSDKNITKYGALIDEAKRLSPASQLYIMAQIPMAGTNNNAVVSFNSQLQNLAVQKGATYVDTYTPLLNSSGTADPECITSDYLYGRGYIKVANTLAEYLQEENVDPVSLEEFETIYAVRTARNTLANAIATAAGLTYGDGIGQYPESEKPAVDALVEQATKILQASDFDPAAASKTATAIESAINSLLSRINQPKPSTDAEQYLYTICSSLRNSYFTTATPTGLYGYTGNADKQDITGVWKFETRTDGTFNIISPADGSYMNPAASHNTQIKLSASEPSTGWTISHASTVGMYVIHSGTSCQLNQTTLNGNQVYNWYGGTSAPDREDAGCQFTLKEYNGKFAESEFTTGWYEIELANDLNGYLTAGTHHILNAENEYRQSNTNYYALKFATKPSDAPKAWVHITVKGNIYQFTSLNGHGIQENCISSRASLPSSNPTVTASATIDGAYAIGKWSYYSNDGNESPYVGKSSASDNSYYLTRVNDSDLETYDIYTVSMTGTTPAAEVGQDVRLTLNHPENKGIRSVYAGGTFFVPKGTTLVYDDFSAPSHAGNANPEITVDPENHTITLDYTKQHIETGISQIDTNVTDTEKAYYNLQGMRMARPTRSGIYIHNGIKIRL